MAKTKGELNILKNKYETLTTKLKELNDNELEYVTGGTLSSAPWSETLETEELITSGGQHQR